MIMTMMTAMRMIRWIMTTMTIIRFYFPKVMMVITTEGLLLMTIMNTYGLYGIINYLLSTVLFNYTVFNDFYK